MEEGRPSTTAMIAAMVRAAHLVLDDDPKILQDPLALGLSGVENEAALRARLEAIETETPVGPRRRLLRRWSDTPALVR
jgi:hypothetical protein